MPYGPEEATRSQPSLGRPGRSTTTLAAISLVWPTVLIASALKGCSITGSGTEALAAVRTAGDGAAAGHAEASYFTLKNSGTWRLPRGFTRATLEVARHPRAEAENSAGFPFLPR